MKSVWAGKEYNSVIRELKRFRKMDTHFDSGKILGSMCTRPHPVAIKAFEMFIETNLGDPALFPGVREIEERLIEAMKNLVSAPSNATGLVVSGGTEGNINAIRIAKILSKKRKIILPEGAHFSFHKVASLMNVDLKFVKLDENYCTDVNELETVIDGDTAAVVAIAGSTELGTIDDIPSISKICREKNVFLHVDAAFGGFIIPFLKDLGYSLPDFDFKLEGVCTVQIDSHKMGCSVIPVGMLLVRDKKWVNSISVESPYVSTPRQATLLGTRPGASVAAAYAVIKHLGKKGYKEIVKKCMQLTKYTAKRLEEIGLELPIKPTLNVVGVKLKNPKKVYEELAKLGWRVAKLERISCIRLVIMPHVTKNAIDKFIPDLEKICKKTGEI
ncbi:MAG: tyrosine decarboxylase MfnA [Thermoplasmata archaeon]|nr:MAG: tyrosine decarboxylase MfnA [Thermoplasmata archaeon]